MSRFCKKCNIHLDNDESIFCPKCGEKLVDDGWQCKNCNTKNRVEALFCQKCGSPKVQPDSTKNSCLESYNKNGITPKKITACILGVILILVIGGLANQKYQKYKEEVEHQQYMEWQKQNEKEIEEKKTIFSDDYGLTTIYFNKENIDILDTRAIYFKDIAFKLSTDLKAIQQNDSIAEFLGYSSDGEHRLVIEVLPLNDILKEYKKLSDIPKKDEGRVQDAMSNYIKDLAERRHARVHLKNSEAFKYNKIEYYVTLSTQQTDKSERQTVYTYLILNKNDAYFITEICPYNDNPSRVSNYFWAAGVLYTIWLEQ